MAMKKSNPLLILSIMVNLILIGGVVYFSSFKKQENHQDIHKQTSITGTKVQNLQKSLRNISLTHNLMQDQYNLNINEMRLIVEIIELSKQFGYLTFKEREQEKIHRLTEETTAWIEKKSTFNTYIKGMNEQLKILLTILNTKPSYQTVGDIQNTISDIVAMMLQRSLVQTNRFHQYGEDMSKNLNAVEQELSN